MNMGDWVVLGKGYTINAIGIIADEAPEEIYDGVFHWQRKVKWLGTNLEYNCKEINGGKYISNFAVAKSRMTVINLQKLVTDKKNEKPYVFIIDEINRGNISKIFGELITLIEDSKREGTAEEACAILPYSGEKFSVPSNVYILGTMNTADRSIALMDTALRRRFDFIEMMPKSEILREKGADKVVADEHELDVAIMLDTINERITFLYDREHTIGHAFFMGLVNEPSIEKLATIFRKSVVPLLQEFFYDDYQKIQLVLGDNGKTDETHKFIKDSKVVARTMFKGNVDDIIDLPEKKFEINDEAFDNILSYIEIM
jgi:5-methylcytosine-specific restriction protein B